MYWAGAVYGWTSCLMVLSPGGVFSPGSGEAGSQIAAFPRPQIHAVPLSARAGYRGESGMDSWVAIGGVGLIYEIQCGDKAGTGPALDWEGSVVRS